MEYLIILGIIGLGYKLQSDQNNKIKKKFVGKVSKNQLPSSENVYTSKRSYNIFQEEQDKANILLEKSKYPQDTNVVTPGPTFPIIYNKVDYSDSTLPVEFNSYQKYDNILLEDNKENKPSEYNLIKNNQRTPNTGGFQGISLTGDPINPNNFTHNNMVPFFGGAVRQNLDEFSTRGIFENFTGTQDNYQKKQEQSLLFQPQKNMSNVYGTGSLDGFMLDRYYVSNIRSNETPIEKVYVGPGLNQGYTNEPSGGFQQPDAQDYATPKTTDEIRVKTNPKISYYGRVVSGEKINKPGKIGTVYKNKPDTFYIQEPDRYFTTTGQVIAQEQRPCIVTKYTNRKTTELKTRTGSAAPTNGTVAQVRSKYKISHKVTYGSNGPRNADSTGSWSLLNMFGLNTPNDYGKQSIRLKDNNRVLNTKDKKEPVLNFKSPIEKGISRNNQKLKSTKKVQFVKNNRENGNYQGIKKSKVYNPNDLPRSTIKETNIHNNHSGILTAQKPSSGFVYDPNNVTRTTIKEMNIHNNHSGMMGESMYKGVAYDPNDVTRTTIKETNIHNNHSGMLGESMYKGVAYDPNDVTRTTVKETNIHNNHSGMMGESMYKGVAYDPNDVTRTTIKETNIHNNHSGMMGESMYKGVAYDPNDVTRTTVKETNIHNNHSGMMGESMYKGVAYDPNDVTRTTIKETNIHNNHSGMMGESMYKGVAYDPNDVTRTTIKETNIHNNHSGMMGESMYKGVAYDPNDVTRTTIKETNIHNNYSGNIQNKNRGNVVYDPNNVTRTTIKETNIHNNYSGVLTKNAPSRGVVYDPTNVARTTTKETTIKNKRKANINNANKSIYIKNNDKAKKTTKETTMINNAMGIASRNRGDGHLVKDIQVPDTIREISSVQYIGDANGPELGAYEVTDVNAPNTMRQFTADIEYFGGSGNGGDIKPMSYEDIYNAEIKAIRGTLDEGYTPGPMGPNEVVSGNNLNVTTSKIGDIQNKYLNERGVQANKVYNSIPQMTHLNITQEKEIVPNEPLADRINPDIVSAFRENPYTKPLDSWA